MLYIIYLIAGILIGLPIGMFVFGSTMVRLIFGTIRTAYDEGRPYLFLDMDKYPDEMLKHKYVLFRVDNKPIDGDSHN